MVKKKGGGGKKMRQDDYDTEDAASVTSGETGRSHIGSESNEFLDSFTREATDEEKIEEAIEQLTEKRTSTRVEALAKLHKFILQYMPTEEISEEFVKNVQTLMRKPSEEEAVLGTQILTVMGLILGADEERFYQKSKNILEPLIKTSKNEKVKVQSIKALAMLCFVCSTEDENVDEVLELMIRLMNVKIMGSICTSALNAWGLVASSLSDELLASEKHIDTFLPLFLNLLDHTDVDTRSAAAQNIALLFESTQQINLPFPCIEVVTERIGVMSKDSSKRNSKKDRKTQRLVFRDVYSTLSNGESPHVSFGVKGDFVDIHSWRSVLQFEAIKDALAVGIQEHLKYNNVVRWILDMGDATEERIVDRRAIFDKKSSSRKQRSNEIKQDRRHKQDMQDAFLDY